MDENENMNNEQPAPVVEKVSLKEIQQEKTKVNLDEDTPFNRLLKAAMALEGDDIKKAQAYLEKKIEKLKNLK